VLVWGILSFIRDLKSFDVWFSAGMTGFLLLTPLVMAVFGPLLRELIGIEITVSQTLTVVRVVLLRGPVLMVPTEPFR